MKKLIIAGLSIGLLAGCGSTDSKSEVKDQTTQSEKSETSTKKTSKHPFPKDAKPVGEGKITVDTPAGNSENGNVPVLFSDKNTIMDQIGLDYANFQGDKQTFVYVDKIFDRTTQVGELTQSTFTLAEDTLKPGVHTVTAVQFENDDPKGKVLNFVEAKYEVKEKK
ncbi:hypothetical protein CON42_30795 [Bacillus thuringiensis]|uniref:hypothetical protein n=1 Tax=Bacillus cereus group TaxID=86661 RepID=UPI000B453625|nr:MULTISPECIES: hypothetical protein [Bacillus cereus group]MED3180147.1 hypothetical protein [Bacillus thuringiensis]OTY14011.1 hypothetical protein BK734_08975 [Bacillus thuringiensis serovar kim]OUB22900.1 hypothetical protein BK733_01145 [Bacillus thuringiensis serovar xiaguangiensis]PDZ57788.1 hypothetical protein CON29_28020 [Bacillus thuringiensis]PEA11727.1 hypothetical protein CON42_30795 [Bacillus thuringiensis]